MPSLRRLFLFKSNLDTNLPISKGHFIARNNILSHYLTGTGKRGLT